MDHMIENINEAELLKLMDCCRLCLSQSQSRVNLLTKERLGLTLMEMVNSLTGLQIDEFSKSLMVCLNCAGKIVNLHEFRELCQISDKRFCAMEMALRLKRMQNQGRPGQSRSMVSLDEDMQIFYVCKVCKVTFEDSRFDEYQEHKKQHIMKKELDVTLPPIKQEGGEKAKRGRPKKSLLPAVEPSTSTPENGSAKRRSRRSPVPKFSPDVPSVHRQSTKIYACDICDQTFVNHKAQYWHRLKTHGFFIKQKGTKPPTTKKSPNYSKPELFSCRYCEKVFDKRYSKYNHERVCTHKEQQQNDESENDSEVVEQPMPVQPVVELTEDDTIQNGDETATAEDIYQCSRCLEEFVSSRARSFHEKIVHNLQINECRSCGKMFSSYPHRYNHQKRCKLNSSAASENNVGGDDEEVDGGIGTSGFQAAFTQSL